MRAWKVAVVFPIAFACLFIAFGGVNYGFSLRSVAVLGTSGFFIGAIAVPELEPKGFKWPVLWQMVFGAIGGAAVAGISSFAAERVLVGALVGLVLGSLAPYWIKHVQLP